MESMVERYIYDVVRRLPEKERDEVSRELEANIYDMLPETPTNDEVRHILQELGSPALLANKYRQSPQYLISPTVYADYVRALKWVVLVVGIICFVIGAVIGGITAISGGDLVSISVFISSVLRKAFSIGFSAAFQAAALVTIGFAIADHVGYKSKTKSWSIDNLPEVPPNKKYHIPLADSIVELIFTVLGSAVLVLLCAGVIPAIFSFSYNNIQAMHVFNRAFLLACIPAITISAVFEVVKCIAQIKAQYWTLPVCTTVVLSNVVSVATTLYMITRPNMFSPGFSNFISSQNWWNTSLLSIAGRSVGNPLVVVVAALVVVISLIESGTAIYRTYKASKIV